MERRYTMGLDSYDRLFPSQDTMPKGGFGNLIALPLQRGPRENGNSVFIAIVGARNAKQAEGVMRAADLRLSEEEVAEIESETPLAA